MKKQELIHLHGLLNEVRTTMEGWYGEEIDVSEYENMGVRPTAIHRSKTDHKAAVFELANGITNEMEGVDLSSVSDELEERDTVEKLAEDDLEDHYRDVLEYLSSRESRTMIGSSYIVSTTNFLKSDFVYEALEEEKRVEWDSEKGWLKVPVNDLENYQEYGLN